MLRPARLVCVAALLVAAPVGAQTEVRGQIVDAITNESLPGATVLAERTTDSLRVGAATDLDGRFALDLRDGLYTLRATFVGYRPLSREVRAGGQPVDLGPLALSPDTTILTDTQVRALRTRVEIRGDTTAYNAEAFRVNPDATAADLVRRLPGVTDGDGVLRANGEEVDRILVDGKEFFQGDQEAALDALPADAIREVQVYDKASDQEELTGFDDGETEQTINLVTKPERRQSLFGRGRAGAGSNSRYETEMKANRFDGDRRVSLTIGSYNVDRDTRSALMGEGPSGSPFGMQRSPEGIIRSTSVGLNLNDSWGDWAEVSASYAYWGSGRETEVALDRDYLLLDAAGQRYSQSSSADRSGARHSLSARAKIQLSERTDLRLDPRLWISASDGKTRLAAQTLAPTGDLLSRSRTETAANGRSVDASVRGTLGHAFAREGRTLSGTLRLNSDSASDEVIDDIEREFRLLSGDSLDAFDRRTLGERQKWVTRGEVVYTEPLSETLQLMVGYEPSVSFQSTDRDGRRLDAAGAYTRPDASVTAASDRWFTSHESRVGLQRTSERFTGTLGFGLRHERLTFDQGGPRAFTVERAETSFAPFARIQLSFGERSSLSLHYVNSTQAPDANQLRDVVDDSNPLRLATGNPDLRTPLYHNAFVQFRTANPEAGTSLTFSGNMSASVNPIVPATFIAGADSMRVGEVSLAPGAQLTIPVNADRSWGGFGFAVYSRPLAALRSNVNLSVNARYSNTPTRINDLDTMVQSLWGGGSVALTTSGMETLDLSLRYGLSASAAWSDAPSTPRSLVHSSSVSADWRPGYGLVLTSRVIGSLDPDREREPLAGRIDLGVGTTFLANDEAQVRLTVSDVLDSRPTANRVVREQYIEERDALALGRIVLLSLSYTVRQR